MDLQDNVTPSSPADMWREAVILVHGLWMRGWVMGLLARHLQEADFMPLPYSYPSNAETLSRNAERLARYADSVDAPVLHFVGHSLGGLLTYKMLSSYPISRPGRVVFLGSPFRDSFAARCLAETGAGQTLLGRSLGEWLRSHDAEWHLPRELGVIAGSKSLGMGRLVAPGLPRPNDGVVAVEETLVAGARDHIVLPVSHSGMLLSPRVAQHVVRFLRLGHFGESVEANATGVHHAAR